MMMMMRKSGSGRREEPVALAYSYQSPRRHGGASDPRGRYYPNISGSKRVFAQDVRPRRWEVDNNDYLDIAERALFDDDDIRDDESEESIKVLLRYCGCNQEGYGKCYRNSTCSFETAGTRLSYERSGDGSDLIESIRTIEEAADDNDRVVEDGTTINIDNDDGENVDGCNEEGYCCYQNSTSTCGNTTGSYDYETSKDDNIEAAAADNNVDNNENLSTGDNDVDDDLLPSPSGKLLMSAGENDDAEAIEMLDIAEGLSVEVSSSSNEGNVVVDDDEENQLSNDELTPTDHRPDDTSPVVEQPDDEAPYDEQPNGNAPYDEQPDENAPIEPQAMQNKSGNIKRAQELMIRCNDHRHSIHDVRVREVEVDIPSRMSHSAMSPSPSVRGRQIALSLHDAPKYPTTKYVEKGDHNDKEVNTECTPAEVQGEKEGPATTLKDSDSDALTNVEEMDMLIKSTRAWLKTQKAERKVRLEMQRVEWKAWENTQI